MLPGVLSVAGGGVGVRSGVGPTPTPILVLTRTIGLSVHVGSNFLNDLVVLFNFLVLVDVPLGLGGRIFLSAICKCMACLSTAVTFPLAKVIGWSVISGSWYYLHRIGL